VLTSLPRFAKIAGAQLISLSMSKSRVSIPCARNLAPQSEPLQCRRSAIAHVLLGLAVVVACHRYALCRCHFRQQSASTLHAGYGWCRTTRRLRDCCQYTSARLARFAAAHNVARSTRSKEELSAIRTWAAKHGHNLSARGRIPGDVVEAYQAARQR
jgi:Lsr2